MAASKLIIDGERNEQGDLCVRIAFPHGPQRVYVLNPSDPLYEEFAAHGFMKKVRDQIKGEVGTNEAVEEVDRLLEAFGAGKWSIERESVGLPTIGYLAQALMRKYDCSEEKAQEFIGRLSKKQQADLRETPEIASIIASIKAEHKARKNKGKELPPSLLDAFEEELERKEDRSPLEV